VRYVAASNWAAWQIQKALASPTDAAGSRSPPCSRGITCSTASSSGRSARWPWTPGSACCLEPTTRWLARWPLRARRLAEPGSRIAIASENAWGEAWSNYDNDRTWLIIDELNAVAREVDRTPAQVALNWLLQRPAVTAPIIGARDPDQLQANLGTVGWDLEPMLVQRLTDVSEATPLPYPHDILAGSTHTAHPH